MRTLLFCLGLLVASGLARAAETIPPAPTKYFNDYALAVKPATAERLNHELADFERATSNQILAVIFPKMLSDSSVDDYALRVFRAWKVGQKNSNGAVLFVFIQDRKMWIQTGYGLEGALPDATCKDIVSDLITPRFKQNDFDGGMIAGVEAMMQAAKGEYKGSGATNYDRQHADGSAQSSGGIGSFILFLLLIGVFIYFRLFSWTGLLFSALGSGSGGGGGFRSSGGGGGGDFFSGGGGSSGGGGAGGSW